MDIRISTRNFESWIGGQTKLMAGDLRHKHQCMALDPFSFLRATYYRWAQLAAAADSRISQAPVVLAVGDLHLENFGTWRDSLGRLAWGINDFDEAYPLPCTYDLIRLAGSARLLIEQDHLRISFKSACRAIVDGYREGIAAGGRPFVIGEEHRWFKPILQSPQRDPGAFWDKLRALPPARSRMPAEARAALQEMLPETSSRCSVRHRIAGLGNLGKPRFTSVTDWQGGPLAREVKALTLSAAAWAQSKSDGPYYSEILRGSVRSADPFLKVHANWIVRRLSPDCRRLELAALGAVQDKLWLLHAMGFETANVHLGTSQVRAKIKKFAADFSSGAIRKAAVQMTDLLMKDFRRWRKFG